MRRSWSAIAVVASLVAGLATAPTEAQAAEAANEARAAVGTSTPVTRDENDHPPWDRFLSTDGRYVTALGSLDGVVSGAGDRVGLFQWDHAGDDATQIDQREPALSEFLATPDGGHVVWSSGWPGVRLHLWDRAAGTSTLVASTLESTAIVPLDVDPSGRFITFRTEASEYVGATGGSQHLFQVDATTGEGVDITAAPGGPASGTMSNYDPSWQSEDGRFVVFVHRGAAYRWDRLTGTSIPIDPGGPGEPVRVTPDGRWVVLRYGHPTLPDDHGLLLWDGADASITQLASGDRRFDAYHVAEDGSSVVFATKSTDLGGATGNTDEHPYLWERSTGAVRSLADRSQPVQIVGASHDYAWMLLRTFDHDLESNPVDDASQVHLLEVATGNTELVAAGGRTVANSYGLFGGWVSDDGSTVTFEASIPHLLATPHANTLNGYQWDRATGTLIPIARPNGNTDLVDVTRDGRYAIFETNGDNVAPGMPLGVDNLYHWDRDTVPTTPLQPVGVFGHPSDAALTIEWREPYTNGSGEIIGYLVELLVDDHVTASREVDGATRTVVIDGLDNGTRYRLRVRARTVGGLGIENRTAWATPSTTPDAPTILDVTPAPGRATVRWEAPNDGGSHLYRYDVTVLRDGADPRVESIPASGHAEGDVIEATVDGLENGVEHRFTVTAVNEHGPGPSSVAAGPATPMAWGPQFVAVSPCRLVDTRADASPLRDREARDLAVRGDAADIAEQGGRDGGCDIPDEAVAIEATVTAVDPTGSGFLRMWPSDAPAPNATFLNYRAGQGTTNTGTIALAEHGPADLTARAFGSSTGLVVEVNGYHLPGLDAPPEGSVFVPATPCRLVDTRSGGGPLADREIRDLAVIGAGECLVPEGAVAIEATVTAVDPTGNGFTRLWPSDAAAPNATVLNYRPGQGTTNTGTIAIAPDNSQPSQLRLRNFGSTSHYVIDIQGWYLPATAEPPEGTVFVPATPCRLLDTRQGGGKLADREIRDLTVTGAGDCTVPDGAVAIEATVTAVDPTGNGFTRLWPSHAAAPDATFLNYRPGQGTTNTGTIAIDPDSSQPSQLRLRNFGSTSHYVIDIQGWYLPAAPEDLS